MGIVVLGRTAAFASLIFANSALPTPAETVLHNFAGGAKDGANPIAGLIFDAHGALYGTTLDGGGTICGEQTVNGKLVPYRCGTIFKLAPPAVGQAARKETVLFSFSGTNGAQPYAGLILDKEGALYGTTNTGLRNIDGTVFKLTPPAGGQIAWKLSTLYTFTGDSGFPQAGLILDKEGALYGTAYAGGGGTVFKLAPPAAGQTAWKMTVLHSFSGFGDGTNPVASLIFDNAGALYGTTSAGGSNEGGTVFQLTPPAPGATDWKETVLVNFTYGAFPSSGLIFDTQGALYGTTNMKGSSNFGAVYKVTPPTQGQTAWQGSVLYSFTGGTDGGYPRTGLILDANGALYGTTTVGGSGSCQGGCGTVFKLTPPAAGQTAWTETVLFNFSGGNGESPFAGVIADKAGTLYGTTYSGGHSGVGTVFKLP